MFRVLLFDLDGILVIQLPIENGTGLNGPKGINWM